MVHMYSFYAGGRKLRNKTSQPWEICKKQCDFKQDMGGLEARHINNYIGEETGESGEIFLLVHCASDCHTDVGMGMGLMHRHTLWETPALMLKTTRNLPITCIAEA